MGRLKLAAPGVIELPEIDESGPSWAGGWIVTVFDNDVNTIDQVINILMVATQCDIREAEIETWEVHHLGRSVVHHGTEKICQEVAGVIGQIGIRVEVSEE